jgi:hypothetical protein
VHRAAEQAIDGRAFLCRCGDAAQQTRPRSREAKTSDTHCVRASRIVAICWGRKHPSSGGCLPRRPNTRSFGAPPRRTPLKTADLVGDGLRVEWTPHTCARPSPSSPQARRTITGRTSDHDRGNSMRAPRRLASRRTPPRRALFSRQRRDEQVLSGDRHNHAVDRPSASVLAEARGLAPSGAVRRRVESCVV